MPLIDAVKKNTPPVRAAREGRYQRDRARGLDGTALGRAKDAGDLALSDSGGRRRQRDEPVRCTALSSLHDGTSRLERLLKAGADARAALRAAKPL